MTDTNPLERLFADDVKNLDLNLISDFLVKYIAIDRNTQEIGFKTPFRKLPGNTSRLEILFLATKARKILINKQEEMATLDVIKMSIMPEGSVKATIKKLFDEKLILKNDLGYYLPDFRVSEVIDMEGKND
jgi:hypothetical protein